MLFDILSDFVDLILSLISSSIDLYMDEKEFDSRSGVNPKSSDIVACCVLDAVLCWIPIEFILFFCFFVIMDILLSQVNLVDFGVERDQTKILTRQKFWLKFYLLA